MGDLLAWLDGWVRTPGFGGAAAVVAALVAYRGSSRERRSSDSRARETRWWEQGRWAAGLLTSNDDEEVALGIAALAQLVDEAADAEAAVFAMRALELVLPEWNDDPNALPLDEAPAQETSWDDLEEGRDEDAKHREGHQVRPDDP